MKNRGIDKLRLEMRLMTKTIIFRTVLMGIMVLAFFGTPSLQHQVVRPLEGFEITIRDKKSPKGIFNE